MIWIDGTLKIIKGRVICNINGENHEFSSGIEAYNQLSKGIDGLERYGVESVSARKDAVIVEIGQKPTCMDKEWIEDYKRKHGVEPNLFDGA